MNKDKLINI